MTTKKPPHIVVLGAGFGGLTFCKSFHYPEARVTLVDHRNHHLFQPLLYQVATAGLAITEIAQPIRSIFADYKHITVLMDEVLEVRLPQKQVVLDKNLLHYDYLVLALGSIPSYFGHPEWEQFAPGLKTLEDAMRIRQQVLLAFERAETEPDSAAYERLMTIVVVGGGPTGVEMAGALGELAHHVLKRDFRRIDPTRARIVLIEAGDRILDMFPPELSDKAEEQLSALGVEIVKNTSVQNIQKGLVELPHGMIPAETIIWAAGVQAHPITRTLSVPLDRAGRVKVEPDLSLPGFPEVFAIGDLASVLQKNGTPVPGVSPAAMQMARHAARMIREELSRSPSFKREAFVYRDKGSMATIGRSAAVAKIKRLEFAGFPAWLAWLFVHLIFLVGFRNKVAVLLQWIYSYFSYRRGARIITPSSEIF